MSRISSRGPHRSDAILLWVLIGTVGVALLLLVVWLALRHKGPDPVKDLQITWTVSPVWKNPPPPATQSPAGDNTPGLEIYLDVSEPIQGFLPPPTASQEFSGFRSLVNQIPDDMVSIAGGTKSSMSWFFVASNPDGPHVKPDPFRRELFRGKESRIDKALSQMVSRLDRGEIGMAALVTDLIATDELVGAMGAAKALSDWGQSDRVRRGELAIGLLGVRGSYWGVYRKCGSNPDLGCWFSEQAQQWRALPRLAKKPFYILILGRGLDKVDWMGKALLEGAQGSSLEAHWELLSGASQSKAVKDLNCHASKADDPRQEQFALLRDEKGYAQCQRAEVVELACPIPPGARAASLKAQASWAGVRTAFRDNKVILTIDCDRIRSTPPTTDLVLTVEGEPEGRWSDIWRKWSAGTDEREEDLDRTLGLEAFIEKVWLRPDRIRMTSSTLFRAEAK
jgi:hypothetical protein